MRWQKFGIRACPLLFSRVNQGHGGQDLTMVLSGRFEGARPARSMTLPPTAASASLARALVRNALCAADRPEWVDAAVLAVSELVTNAALHAHTSVEVSVDVGVERVRVEVRDFSAVLPTQRRYDVQATTGRGMALIAALTRDCGVNALGLGGKVVWFEVADDVGDGGELTADELFRAWDREAADPLTASSPGYHERGELSGGADTSRWLERPAQGVRVLHPVPLRS